MNTPSPKPICDTDPSRRGGIDLNAEALGDLYAALGRATDCLEVLYRGQSLAHVASIPSIEWLRAALRKAEQVQS